LGSNDSGTDVVASSLGVNHLDIFDHAKEELMKKEAPLALRMRPRTLEQFVGQEHLVGPGKVLRRLIEADRLSSLILYGPPGTGKSTLARVIAENTRAHFTRLNAVTSGVADIRRVVGEAGERLGMYQQRTILFIDEIHRFNKSQQDALLPYVEDGTVILIGATTENPFFEVNSPLLSRSRVFPLYPLSEVQLDRVLEMALIDRDRGLGNQELELTAEARQQLIRGAEGDARVALNALELAALLVTTPPDGKRVIDVSVIQEAMQRKPVLYDKGGDQHYDTISAFIKSMRGSDPDAVLHYLARMLYAGEDPVFIARRIVIHAAEDVGLADPMALVVAAAAAQAVQLVGLPEGRLPLAEAALYVACAPKSNAVVAGIGAAMADIENLRIGRVPVHLRDSSYKGAAKLGHGQGYKYPHDFPGNYVSQQYLPDELAGRRYFRPGENGGEKSIRERLPWLFDKDK
jgi:putative ATPase